MALDDDAAKRWRYFLNADGSGPDSANWAGGLEKHEKMAEDIWRQ